jgi:uncharacterized protein YjbI with pentapeptide repeats
MRWLKRDMWKAGIALVGLLLLLVLMMWVPVSAASTSAGASGLATPITGAVQETPTVDATVTELNKEKLAQEVQQLKNQNESDLLGWLRTNAAILLSTLVVVIGGLIGLFRWFGDRRDAQGKDLRAQAEERFRAAIAALGDENEATQVGGAILLRSFLNPEDKEIYGRYYTQIFDLAVAYLHHSNTPQPSEDPDGLPPPPEDPNAPVPLTPLRQALIVVFREAFPLARDRLKERGPKNQFNPQSLDASSIKLDGANLRGADLKQVWMPEAYLRKTDLKGADLSWANLYKANLSEASLTGADLSGANLIRANLFKAWFRLAKLDEARLREANLSRANLEGADLSGAKLNGVINLEEALSLKDTDLRGVKGLTKEQLLVCKAKGAIVDEDATTSPPQSPASPPVPTQSNNAQAPSTPPAQVNTPPPDLGGNDAASSQPSPKL